MAADGTSAAAEADGDDALAVEQLRADRDGWLARREQALAAARRSRTVSATALATAAADARRAAVDDAADAASDPGLAKSARNLDLPAWQKGRYGTAVGRAVHGVLQTCDLATGHDIEAGAAAQAAAEGILGREAVVARLARSALASPTVAAAVDTTPLARAVRGCAGR